MAKNNILISFVKIISVLLILTIILALASLGLFIYFNSPADFNNTVIVSEIDGITLADDGSFYIEVRRGESSRSVGRRLERAGLIRNRYFWDLLCRFENEHIKVGTYNISEPKTQLAILRLLIAGRQILYRVTIPEGVTLKRTARILQDAGICSLDDFLLAASDLAIIRDYNIPSTALSMEGYLFPDTYMFPKDFPAHMVVKTMADNFFNKLYEISPSLINMSANELNAIVIMASIVEREYRVQDEAPLMAGIFFNRLRINMRLESCATIEYVITEILGRPHPTRILNVDLEIRSPYNTYMFQGLPPGPISAPGIVALRAAVYPQTTNYLFFRLIDPVTGKHHFSRTYDEHIRAGELLTKPVWP
ncbi:MAG: endolytic transglycosylase MltG [Treponema sp.]|nr:endolytic transglycosylase MltG [Treponema sp.]